MTPARSSSVQCQHERDGDELPPLSLHIGGSSAKSRTHAYSPLMPVLEPHERVAHTDARRRAGIHCSVCDVRHVLHSPRPLLVPVTPLARVFAVGQVGNGGLGSSSPQGDKGGEAHLRRPPISAAASPARRTRLRRWRRCCCCCCCCCFLHGGGSVSPPNCALVCFGKPVLNETRAIFGKR